MMSRKSAIIVVAISAFGALVAVPAFGQGPRRQRRAIHYNPATEVREKGTVEDVWQVGDNRGWILLRTDMEDLDVHLCPTTFIADSGFSFAKGNHIEVLGSKVKVGATDSLKAREVREDGKSLVLRGVNGIRKWSRARRGI